MQGNHSTSEIKVKTWKHLAFSGLSVAALNLPLMFRDEYPDFMHAVNALLLFGGVCRAWSEEVKNDDLSRIDLEEWQNDVESGRFQTYEDSRNYHKNIDFSPLRNKR